MSHFTVDTARALPGPDWLKDRRTAAAEEFIAASMPTESEEEWRYSPIADLRLDSYRLADVGEVADHEMDDKMAVGAIAEVDIVNGCLVSVAGLQTLTSHGVTVQSAADYPAGRDLLGSVINGTADYFTQLNDAFTPTPVIIEIPANTMLDGVIAVHHHTTHNGVASFPRLIVRVGANAQAQIVNVESSESGVLVVPVVELDVQHAGRLSYVNLQRHHPQAWQVALHAAQVHRDAQFVNLIAGFGGGYARTRSATTLAGRGATGNLLSAYLGSGDQTLDFRTFQDHAAADTTSNLLYIGAVGDTARSIYTGLIRVRPEARGTNAFQTNRNLKLSDQAWVESVPNLEIENNEVRCSHASTVGPIDEDQLYYLESRGIPTQTAERLIASGFFEEVLSTSPVKAVEQEIRNTIAAKLDQQLRIAEHAIG
ncbi:MAG: SufD family Fe-S cluster assembly protein [Acidimicrobiaceae bacterium]|nr:SufD family Fe-S cluster assembly protein [Acidimicrobiaceae bacterium]